MTVLKEQDITFQWALPEALQVPKDQLRARVDIYGEAILLHLLDGGVITTKLVSALDIAQAFTREMSISSGLLPGGTLFWANGKEGPEVGLWRPPRVWRVALQREAFQASRRFRLPMPGLIFVCQPGRPPFVFAVKRRPVNLEEKVYHAPLFNLFRDGRSCQGTHKYGGDIAQIPEEFFTAFFTPTGDACNRSKRFPDTLLKLWENTDGKKHFPVGDLEEFGTVSDILEGKTK